MLPRGLRGAPKCHRCRHHHLLRKDFQVHRPCRSEGLLDNYRKRFQKVHRRNLHPQTYIQCTLRLVSNITTRKEVTRWGITYNITAAKR
ncbi:uncharacterized protein LOC110678038 isoform X2 [Aedes aegypti]|uniref:Uncharacterized protein n=1 Tax=Aedes aegypti TaxID=7159 RepID=A0A6I8U3R3_AEDAE|nr:uncharacterized protein LOC110678038 isoform X2 [Aedes aegypti]